MKQIPIEFLQMVEKDISLIDAQLEKPNNPDEMLRLQRQIDGHYQACVQDWKRDLHAYNMMSFLRDNQPVYLKQLGENLEMMKAKLETYRFQVNAVPNLMPPSTNVTVKVDNNINVNITFDQVRIQVEDMTSLTAAQTQEVIDKINEIEAAVTSKDSKKTKWENMKPVLSWLAEKSVDVGAVLLPLLLKIQ
ncbi:MAG: hypothetical protein PHV32_11715 [Eubacteriales bacterium]|nr:hypothetical protein [Eubacteriales bacterium]